MSHFNAGMPAREVFWTNVHGNECELGCWVEGSWGQYGPDHLTDKIEIEWPEYFDDRLRWHADVRVLRDISETLENMGYNDAAFAIWEMRNDATDDMEVWLNDGVDEGYSWGWHDGEFYLWATETWEEVY